MYSGDSTFAHSETHLGPEKHFRQTRSAGGALLFPWKQHREARPPGSALRREGRGVSTHSHRTPAWAWRLAWDNPFQQRGGPLQGVCQGPERSVCCPPASLRPPSAASPSWTGKAWTAGPGHRARAARLGRGAPRPQAGAGGGRPRGAWAPTAGALRASSALPWARAPPWPALWAAL